MSQQSANLLEADASASNISDLSGGFWSKGNSTDAYDECFLRTTYRTFPGRLLYAVAGEPPQDSRCFRVCAPTTIKIVEWQMVRQGLPPISPKVVEDDGPLLSCDIVPSAPTLMADGITKRYVVTGSYTYALTTAKLPGDSSEEWKTGKAPIATLSDESTKLTDEDFSDLYEDGAFEPEIAANSSTDEE